MNRHKQNLMSWFTGRTFGLSEEKIATNTGTDTIVLEDKSDLEAVISSEFVRHGTVLYVPGDPATPERTAGCGITVVSYSGSFSTLGSEVQLGDDFFLQLQGHSIAGFLALLGPTAVRVADDDDAQSFIDDADAARTEGRWSDVFTNPSVQLADTGALGGWAPSDSRSMRLLIDAGHRVRVSPLGPIIGTMDSSWSDLEDDTSALPVPITPQLDAQIVARPWLSRYHSALQALQALRAHGVDHAQVSGFCYRVDPALLDVDVPADIDRPWSPLVLESGGLYYVYSPGQGRLMRSTAELAAALDRALTLSNIVDDTVAGRDAARFISSVSAA